MANILYDAIDVSKHQGTVNWDNVKNAGISHVMIRAGYGRYSSQKDPQFERNVRVRGTSENVKREEFIGVPIGIAMLPALLKLSKRPMPSCLS